jgi:hypothetical protein
VAIYDISQSGRFNTFFPLREALALPNLASVNGASFRRTRHGSGRTMVCLDANPAQAGTELRANLHLIGPNHMIEFPNHSRSYDRTRRAVRFWGYDSAIEASFFIDEGALRRIQPDAHPDESGFLNAFDSNRDLICAAAASVYVRGSRGSYDLVAANF